MVSQSTAVELVEADAIAGEPRIFSLPEYFHEKVELRVEVVSD